MARYGFNWEQTLTVETNEADREKVIAPPLRHVCPEFLAVNKSEYDFYLWGGAITESMEYHEDVQAWRIDNGEYASAVRFCPYCGLDLMTLVPKE